MGGKRSRAGGPGDCGKGAKVPFGGGGDWAQKQGEAGRRSRIAVDGETDGIVADDENRGINAGGVDVQQRKVRREGHWRRTQEGIGQGGDGLGRIRQAGAEQRRQGIRERRRRRFDENGLGKVGLGGTEIGFGIEIAVVGFGEEGRKDDKEVVVWPPQGPIGWKLFEAGLPGEIGAADADQQESVALLTGKIDGADDVGPKGKDGRRVGERNDFGGFGKRAQSLAGFVGCGEEKFGAGAVGDAPCEAQCAWQAGVAVDKRRHQDPKSARGGKGRAGPKDDDGLTALGDDAVRDALQQRSDAPPRVPADDDCRGAEFCGGVENAAGDAGIQPCERNGVHARGFCAGDCAGKEALGFGDADGVVGTRGGDVEGKDGVGGTIGTEHEGKVEDGVDMGRGGEGYQDASGILAWDGGGSIFPFGDAAGGFFGDPWAEDAGDENHQDGAVENVVAEDAHADADEHGGEGCGSLVDAEAEEEAGFVARKAEDAARKESGQPFSADDACDHESGDGPAAGSGDQDAKIDAHADGKQKERDEQGIADEVEPAGQDAATGHDGAEGEAREKRADDGFHAGEFGGVGKEKHDG